MRQREYLLVVCLSLVPHLVVSFWRQETSCIISLQLLVSLSTLSHAVEAVYFLQEMHAPPHWSVLDKTFKNHSLDSSKGHQLLVFSYVSIATGTLDTSSKVNV